MVGALIKTLAHHFCLIIGALDIEGPTKPIGALALVAAAVKRILWLYVHHCVHLTTDAHGVEAVVITSTYQAQNQKTTGKITKSDFYFSEKYWGVDVFRFSETTAALPIAKFERIMEAVWVMATEMDGHGGPASSSKSSTSSSSLRPHQLHISNLDDEQL
ncbi:hypothetical protein OBBRIDRAFT_804841 [Obba rivulosa]|uniref:Uncharacterized protein n=1 Tax=Obba rivulosa TaxID=1052685 RepID=A0A8E2AU51_9APHY|nr:hypothetical protein OBBRIDRAFT_804841 [Obba rivulosa]